VPSELSVIGIDNHDLSESFGLTTIAQDPFEQGARGARILLEDLAGTDLSRRTSIRADAVFVQRSSTARLG
jgi:DNA-binding LacI/PurR family transcriptional regulator